MRTITIENRVIGEGQPAFIIAEGCDNHMGNMEAASSCSWPPSWGATSPNG